MNETRKNGRGLLWWSSGLHASNAGDVGSIPGWGTKILQAMQPGPKKKKKKFFKHEKITVW